jgi:ATP-dependent metalloprotease
LNAVGQSEAVVSLFEGQRVAFTSETLGEYVKALSRLDRLDNSRVFNLMQVRAG